MINHQVRLKQVPWPLALDENLYDPSVSVEENYTKYQALMTQPLHLVIKYNLTFPLPCKKGEDPREFTVRVKGSLFSTQRNNDLLLIRV